MLESPEVRDLVGPSLLGAGLGLAVGAAFDSWTVGILTAILAFTAFLAATKMS